jgi:hypothetical protein
VSTRLPSASQEEEAAAEADEVSTVSISPALARLIPQADMAEAEAEATMAVEQASVVAVETIEADTAEAGTTVVGSISRVVVRAAGDRAVVVVVAMRPTKEAMLVEAVSNSPDQANTVL